MTRVGRTALSCALAALLAGCLGLPAVFEDIGDDPHPPELTLLGIGLKLSGDPPPPTAYVAPAAGLTLRPYDKNANTLALRFSYADAAADIATIVIRDLDGPLGTSLAFETFPGTSGITEGSLVVPEGAMPGPHHLEVWAEDEKLSRSEKTSFTVTVEIP